ncbi:DsbA family protein [Ferrovibrio sp.]|uniref:DsbA family protein n=1 Tax=Ferrovibrio sp. TaxID=1917215 RepID=UPI002624CB65|nr:DsbA family protein [Ferrovibrio sp.]
MKYIQRFILTLVLALAAGLAVIPAGESYAQTASGAADPRLQDMVLGKADAKVTIIEYASLTCPHCATFHAEVLPAIKTEYLDTGKAKLIFRDFPLDNLAFAGAVLARCGGPDRYFTFLSVLFAQQRQWAGSSDPKAALTQIARLGGIPAEQFDKCLADKALGDYILNQRLEGNQKFNVNSTPTLIINGKAEAGVPSLDELRKKLDALAK